MGAGIAPWPHVRRAANKNFDKLGLGASLIISNSKAPWDVLANSVGSDIVNENQSYPLNFRQLEEKDTRPNAPVANGYSTSYGEITKC
jgi:hypothetical protein